MESKVEGAAGPCLAAPSMSEELLFCGGGLEKEYPDQGIRCCGVVMRPARCNCACLLFDGHLEGGLGLLPGVACECESSFNVLMEGSKCGCTCFVMIHRM